MTFIRPPSKKNLREGLRAIGISIEKHRNLMIALTGFVLAFAVFFAIYWQFDESSDGASPMDIAYLCTHISLAVFSAGLIALFIFNKLGKINRKVMAISVHVYVFLLMGAGALLGCLDLSLGISPILFLLIAAAVSGLYVVVPMFFFITVALGLTAIFVCDGLYGYLFFDGLYGLESLISLIFFGVVVFLSCHRQYMILVRENEAREELERLTYVDDLTGLLNERSYVLLSDEMIAKKDPEPYAIVMMDVNRLKATNDKYGHRYGCSLVVHAGHALPTLFPTSKLFHVGGDEFIAFVIGEDLENLEARIKKFDEECENTPYEFDGVTLAFSIARGYAVHQEGERFQETIQRADDAMYENKKAIKEKFGWKGR